MVQLLHLQSNSEATIFQGDNHEKLLNPLKAMCFDEIQISKTITSKNHESIYERDCVDHFVYPYRDGNSYAEPIKISKQNLALVKAPK